MNFSKLFSKRVIFLLTLIAALLAVKFIVFGNSKNNPFADKIDIQNLVENRDPVIVAAGDIVCASSEATLETCQHQATSDLVLEAKPDAVFALGDLQYEEGLYEDFMKHYEPTWGRFKSKTFPVLGNHEVNYGEGYFDYFYGDNVDNGLFGERRKGYYSFNIGSWHVVALNSNCEEVKGGGCGVGSDQERWLRLDLANSPNKCTIALIHHPFYTTFDRGPAEEIKPLVQALYDNGADVLLSAHSHMYEQFLPQNTNYEVDNQKGIRAFTVGTGGKDLTRLDNGDFANLVVREGNTFGVLKMTLHQENYNWEFVPISESSFKDSGEASCH